MQATKDSILNNINDCRTKEDVQTCREKIEQFKKDYLGKGLFCDVKIAEQDLTKALDRQEQLIEVMEGKVFMQGLPL
jgi:hypothetical protein